MYSNIKLSISVHGCQLEIIVAEFSNSSMAAISEKWAFYDTDGGICCY